MSLLILFLRYAEVSFVIPQVPRVYFFFFKKFIFIFHMSISLQNYFQNFFLKFLRIIGNKGSTHLFLKLKDVSLF